MNFKSKYFLEKNFIVYFIGKLISSIFSIATIPIFIKTFGVSEYGKFSLTYTTFLMFLSGTTGWIIQGILRFSSLETNKILFYQEINNITIKTAIISGVIISIFYLVSGIPIDTTFILFFTYIIGSVYSVYTVRFQANFESKKVIFSDIFRTFLFLFLPITFHFFKIKLTTINLIFLSVFFSYIGGLILLKNWKTPLNFKTTHNSEWTKKIWEYSYPLGIWMFLSPSMNSSDKFILRSYWGTVVLGQYSAVFDVFFKLFSQISSPFISIVQPLLIANYNSGLKSEFKKILLKSGIYLSLMFLILFVLVNIFIDLLFNKYLDFDSSTTSKLKTVVIPLLISSYIWQISVLLQKILEAKNKTKLMAAFMFISVLTGLLFSLYFVPKFGFLATSYTTLLSSILYLFLISITIIKKPTSFQYIFFNVRNVQNKIRN